MKTRARSAILRRLVWAILLSPFIPYGNGNASETIVSLSFSEALQRAESSAPILVRSQREMEQVNAKRVQAGLWFTQNPYFTFMGGYRRETTSTPIGTGFQYQVHLEQSLEPFGQRSARLSLASAQKEVAEALFEQARLDTRAQVLAAYVRSVLLLEQVHVSQRRESLAQQLLDSARIRRDVGAASDVEVNLARIEIGRVSADLAEAEVMQRRQFSELRVLCGIAGSSIVELVGLPSMPFHVEAAMDAELLRALSIQHRPEISTLKKKQQVLKAERIKLTREAAPLMMTAIDVQRDLPGQIFYGGTLGLTLPIWNRNQGPLASLAAEEHTLHSEQKLLLVRIENEVMLARSKLLLLRDRVSNFQKDILPPAEQNVELLRRGWQAGKFDLFRVISASRELTEARIHFLTLQRELWEAAIELDRAVGIPIITGGLS